MKLQYMYGQAKRLLNDNSQVILTGVAVSGTLLTGYLAAKAGFRAGSETELDEDYGLGEIKPTKNIARDTWKLYVPATTAAIGTCTAMVLATRIGISRTAAVAATLAYVDRNFDDYKNKVAEKIGVNKEQKIADETVQDRVRANPPSKGQVVFLDNGDVLCFEDFTGRYFMSSREHIERAVNKTNQQINQESYASLTYFYNCLGLASTAISDEMGWTIDEMCDVTFTSVLTEEDKPALAIHYDMTPFAGAGLARGIH